MPDINDYAPKKKTEAAAPEERKKVEQVATQGVIRKKPNLFKRITSTFVGGSLKSALNYVVLDVLVPATKDMVADAGSQAIDRVMFGESRHGNRSRVSGHNNGYVNYNRVSKPGPQTGYGRDNARSVSPMNRSAQVFDEIVFASRDEANTVLDRLYDLLSQYQMATVADLFDLCGVTSTHVDGSWGWYDLTGAGVTATRGGYLLDLPRPESIK